MMRLLIVGAGLVVAGLAATPAGAADYPGPYRVPAHRSPGYGFQPVPAQYAPPVLRPAPLYPEGLPPYGIVGYRRAYIATGLVYNVPPEPRVRAGRALRVRY